MSQILLTRDAGTTRLPSGWEGLVAHGTESWTWRLMDLDRTIIEESLDGVAGGSLNWNVNAETRMTASMTWTGHVADEPNWLRVLLQPVFTLTAVDGTTWSWPMGVYLPARPSATHGEDGQVTVELTLYDRTLAMRQSRFDTDVSYAKGTSLTGVAMTMAGSVVGFEDVAIEEDLTLTARSPMVWEPGTDTLQVANDALEAAGYFALWADGEGRLRSSEYVPPRARPVVWSFRDGPMAVYGPEVTYTRDLFNAHNAFTAYSRADGDEPALVASAIIPNEHPLSAISRGSAVRPRWIDRVETDVEAASQAVLQRMVNRWRDEAMNPSTTLEIEHLPLPIFLQDRVNFHRDSSGLEIPAVVETMSIECEPGSLWRTTLREVAA